MEVSALSMVGICILGFVLADHEKDNLRFLHAMRICTLRLYDLVHNEYMKYPDMLMYIHLYSDTQQKLFTEILHAAVNRMTSSTTPQVMDAFANAYSKIAGLGMLSQSDCAAFQALLYELDRPEMDERIKCLAKADAYLGKREYELAAECAVRANLIRALSVVFGAAVCTMLA